MPGILFSLWLAALPAVLLILLFLRLDRARPEPRGLVLKAVLLGFAAIIPAAVIEILLDWLVMPLIPAIPLLQPAIHAFLAIALVEEGVKYFFLRRAFYRKAEFDEVMDGIVYAVCLSMGFALLENVLYGVGEGWGVLLMRAFTAIPLHAAATGVMGYYLGLSKRPGASDQGMKGLAWAVGIHGLYDFSIFAGGWFPLLLLPVIAGGLWTLARLTKEALALDRASAAGFDTNAGSAP